MTDNNATARVTAQLPMAIHEMRGLPYNNKAIQGPFQDHRGVEWTLLANPTTWLRHYTPEDQQEREFIPLGYTTQLVNGFALFGVENRTQTSGYIQSNQSYTVVVFIIMASKRQQTVAACSWKDPQQHNRVT